MTQYQVWYRETMDAEWQPLTHSVNEGGSVVTEDTHEAAQKWRDLVLSRLPLAEVTIREVKNDS